MKPLEGKLYYQPLPNEIKVGLCIEKYKPFLLRWEKITIEDDDLRSDLDKNNNLFTDCVLNPTSYRIKILDKEDIEEEGFKYIKSYSSKVYPLPIEVYLDRKTNWCISKYTKSLFIRIHNTGNKQIKKLKYIDQLGTTFFMGNVKNKTEFEEIIEKFS